MEILSLNVEVLQLHLEWVQIEKSVDYSSIQNCVWAYHFVSVRKLPTSLLEKWKRITSTHFTSQQFWKQTKNDLKWCNFKMHVTGYFSIIKHLLWRASKEPFSFLFWFSLLCYYSFFCVWFSCEDIDVKLK